MKRLLVRLIGRRERRPPSRSGVAPDGLSIAPSIFPASPGGESSNGLNGCTRNRCDSGPGPAWRVAPASGRAWFPGAGPVARDSTRERELLISSLDRRLPINTSESTGNPLRDASKSWLHLVLDDVQDHEADIRSPRTGQTGGRSEAFRRVRDPAPRLSSQRARSVDPSDAADLPKGT